jgi:hypothetical protein
MNNVTNENIALNLIKHIAKLLNADIHHQTVTWSSSGEPKKRIIITYNR